MSDKEGMSKESLPSNASEHSLDQEVQQFNGVELEQNHDLERTETLLQKVQTKLSFFNERLKVHRNRLFWQSVKIYLIMAVSVLAVFSIYWGSYFERENRFKNLRMLVVIEDDQPSNSMAPHIGNAIRLTLASPQAQKLGQWHIYNSTEFADFTGTNGLDPYTEIQKQVHEQHFWASIYVKPNATYNLYQAIASGNSSYNVSYNSIVSYYETGRDIIGMGTYVTPNINKINQMFLRNQSGIYDAILNGKNTSELFSNPAAVKVATSSLEFFFIDGIPFTDPVIVAPAQVGLIYMVILTFFSFNFFASVYQEAAKMNLKPISMLLYRVGSTVLSFLVLSFFFSMVSLAFQVDFTKAFGKGGWPIYWATNFLTMWAVGAVNEAVGMMIILWYPPMIGFWLLFWVVTNISATFSPIALTPNFYRYSYAMPIHASYEITKVILFDTYRGALGRNYGILVAWVVLATIALTALAIVFGKTMGKRAAIEKKKQEEEILEKYRVEETEGIDLQA